MRLKKYKQLLSFIFIAAFLLLKAVNLHAFSHAFEPLDQGHDCELCEFYIANSENHPVSFPAEIPEISIPVLYVSEPVQVNYIAPYIAIPISGYFFNKPPPTP
jgi:hypothetical protein